MEPTITIPTELANAILAYLQERPFREVFQMIQALLAIANKPAAAKNEETDQIKPEQQ